VARTPRAFVYAGRVRRKRWPAYNRVNTKIVTLAALPAVYQVWSARASAPHLRSTTAISQTTPSWR
jgi:hypothetical protein